MAAHGALNADDEADERIDLVEWFLRFEVGEVGWEDEVCLDEGDEERGDDDPWDVAPDFAADAANEEHGHEGDDDGEDPEDGDDHDLVGPAGCGEFGGFAGGHAGVDIFADDDGVVGDDAEDDDEGEQGDHVHADVDEREEDETAGEGDGDAEGDVEG